MTASSVLEQLIILNEDYHSFNPGPIPTQNLPTPLGFSKQVNRGFPCVYNLSLKQEQQSLSAPSDKHGKNDRTNAIADEYEGITSYPAFSWTKDYIINKITSEVEVAVTPDGRADALVEYGDSDEEVFLQPGSIQMSMRELFEKLCPSMPAQFSLADENNLNGTAPSQTPSVYYLQSQNSNLTSEDTGLSSLLPDLPRNFPFAESVLGEPEAINIWIGDERSVTSAHRDPYENLYLVLKGEKTFTLWAPVDEFCMSAKMVRTGRYTYQPSIASTNDESHGKDIPVSAGFTIQLDDDSPILDPQKSNVNDNDTEKVVGSNQSRASSQTPSSDSNNNDNTSSSSKIPWIPIDPSVPRRNLNFQYPNYKYAKPRKITVGEGQMLYLPSGWFHHVQQKCGKWKRTKPRIEYQSVSIRANADHISNDRREKMKDETKQDETDDEGEDDSPCIAINYWYDQDYEGEKYVMRQLINRLLETMRVEHE